MSRPVEAVDQILVEWIARQMLEYQDIIFTHKVIISRLNPEEVEESVERIGQMLQITASWHHPLSEDDDDDDVDEFLVDCDQLCSTPPESLVDRVKILYGAWTALNYLLISVAPRLPRGTWKAGQKRYYELAQQRFPFQLAYQAVPPHPTRPHRTLRPLTESESYKNPENLLGKQFVLFPGTENEMVYKVVAYTRAEDKSFKYTVLFHDCDDFPMEEHEVASQLAYSLIYTD
ncbi:hypothetical protein M378DRAFT_198738 [Amanita muscaria Koide BX008]|uniref:Uncharacterized protein n=1 Tax=Amanita muscaria (strain Koide BX008) TaxID=946122 RepID=A0A0C2X356_AMAMK|nr:hypothetical protein M378DRAFT_198738 [Amanita muscaria Koide BX008]